MHPGLEQAGHDSYDPRWMFQKKTCWGFDSNLAVDCDLWVVLVPDQKDKFRFEKTLTLAVKPLTCALGDVEDYQCNQYHHH